MSAPGFGATITCHKCGGPVVLVASGRSDGLTSRAVVQCDDCGRRYVVQMTMAHAPELGTSPRHKPDCACARCSKGRATHCPQGHAYDDANVYRTTRGTRECRTCRRDRAGRAKGAA